MGRGFERELAIVTDAKIVFQRLPGAARILRRGRNRTDNKIVLDGKIVIYRSLVRLGFRVPRVVVRSARSIINGIFSPNASCVQRRRR